MHGHKTLSFPSQPKDVLAYSTNKPSEALVAKDTYKSTAGPEEPKYLALPTIHAEGYIQKMGIDQNNQVAAPNNVNLAGWYVNSLVPGQAGLSIVDGHVDGLHGPGIFLNLSKLAPGDQFTVELGNGTVQTFKVRQVSNVDDSAATTALFSRDSSIASQLNLITCGGIFDQKAHAYKQRTIVVSELLKS
jgi:LPXTG-site transpeptidase (sortase) family protein